MQLERLTKIDSSLNSLPVFLMILFLVFASFATTGCSKAEKKPEDKKQVVTEMQIEVPAEEAKEEEVESLPYDADESSEEELPILGDGG